MASPDMVLLNLSGTRLGFTGSVVASVSILCGVSGAAVVPLACMADGTLLVSGPQ